MKGGTSHSSPIPMGSPNKPLPQHFHLQRLHQKSTQMELDISDSNDEKDRVADEAPLASGSVKKQDEEIAMMDYFQSLSKDLQSVHIVLDQVRRLASGSRRSKELALAGMQDKLTKVCAMIEKLCTSLEVGKVSSMVKDMKKETQQMKKETKKPLSYVEVAHRGVPSHSPAAIKSAAV